MVKWRNSKCAAAKSKRFIVCTLYSMRQQTHLLASSEELQILKFKVFQFETPAILNFKRQSQRLFWFEFEAFELLIQTVKLGFERNF